VVVVVSLDVEAGSYLLEKVCAWLALLTRISFWGGIHQPLSAFIQISNDTNNKGSSLNTHTQNGEKTKASFRSDKC
jgi:hypothetical protein